MLFALIIITLVLLLVACKNAVDEDDMLPENVDNTFLESYTYTPKPFELSDIPYPIHGAITHGDHIYYWYVDSDNSTRIVCATSGGITVSDTIIQMPDKQDFQVPVMQITNDDNFAIITVSKDSRWVLSYSIYTRQGELISSYDISYVARNSNRGFRIEQAVIDKDGNLALIFREGSGSQDSILYLINTEGSLIGEIQINSNTGLTRLKDGRVVWLHRDPPDNYTLRTIDFSKGSWGESIPLNVENAARIFSASAGQPFDLLLDTGHYIVGYSLETTVQTRLFSWLEAGVDISQHLQLGFLSAGDAILVDSLFYSIEDELYAQSEIILLERAERMGLSTERTVITLGGFYIAPEVRMEVAAFNRENPDYMIEIIEYSGDWDAANLRFITDMITGNGPDIVQNYLTFNPVFLADLYTFIDADSELNREDFFANFLQQYETPDGVLSSVSPAFIVNTMLALRENAEIIAPFTFESFFDLLSDSESDGMSVINMDRRSFLFNVIAYSGDKFIDLNNNLANLDSDEFINLLEVAAILENERELADDWYNEEWRRFFSGNTLLHHTYLHDPLYFRWDMATFSGSLNWAEGDIVAVGMPTPVGGRHGISFDSFNINYGINATSEHKDAAWSFIRRFLHSDFIIPDKSYLPIRIDLFEAMLIEEMTQDFADGVEQPKLKDIYGNALYAMTEAEAAIFRKIVETAVPATLFDEVIWDIIREDSEAFFTDTQSAADAAAVMQSRMQRYLWERG